MLTKRDADALRRYVDRLVPLVSQELLRAFRRLERRLTRKDWLRAVQTWDVGTLRAVLDALARDLADAALVIETAIVTTARRTARMAFASEWARLDLVNPQAVMAARTQSAAMVTAITSRTRTSLQTLVTRAYTEGIAPRDLEKLIRPMVGLTERQSSAVLTRKSRLEAQGLPADRVTREVDRYAAKLLKSRAVTIARTETIQASVRGQQATWQAAQQAGLLPRTALQRWLVTPDDKLCPECSQMTGARALAPIGGLFSTPLGMKSGPPMHPRCRCAVAVQRHSLALPRRAAA